MSHRHFIVAEKTSWSQGSPCCSLLTVFLEGHILLVLFYPINLIAAHLLNDNKRQLLATVEITIYDVFVSRIFFTKAAGQECSNAAKFLRTPLFIEHPWWLLPCNFIKKENPTKVFSFEISEIFKNTLS